MKFVRAFDVGHVLAIGLVAAVEGAVVVRIDGKRSAHANGQLARLRCGDVDARVRETKGSAGQRPAILPVPPEPSVE